MEGDSKRPVELNSGMSKFVWSVTDIWDAYSSNGITPPQLLAMKRLVVDDLAAAATKSSSDWPVASSKMAMVEMMVCTFLDSRRLVTCSMLLSR